jgi:TM2 domain-containing membrane protein YozV
MRKLIISMSLILAFFSVIAQNTSNELTHFNDFNFIIHLTKNKLFSEAEKERDSLFATKDLNPLYIDSVNYLIGIAYYNEKKFDEAKQSLMKVSENVFFYFKARYLAGLIDAENNQFEAALTNYKSISESTNPDLNELQKFEIAGLYLLEKKYNVFDSISKNFVFKNELLNVELENLKRYATLDRNLKRKSMLVAGCLSAIVPGLGKVYAGNNGQALASFLTCGVFGAIASENIIKYGIQHPQALFFTSMFGLFYIGNIWGSALSVQLVKTEKQFENKHNILVGLKLPISKFFN